MERLDAILHHEVFCRELDRLAQAEKDRIYCRHDLEHLLAVARTAYILNLERQAGLPQDLLYAASLLHDIGRARQYETGEPHREAGVTLAQEILQDTSFTPAEQAEILDCIRSHHHGPYGGRTLLELISEADHRSRPCFACPAAETCKWSMERRNLSLTI
ncbi:MAG: HD domain-containing protein [Oscillospiraceae bacterium]|nr:HD domain-containing protein [Oscillospiraceae bacterium]